MDSDLLIWVGLAALFFAPLAWALTWKKTEDNRVSPSRSDILD